MKYYKLHLSKLDEQLFYQKHAIQRNDRFLLSSKQQTPSREVSHETVSGFCLPTDNDHRLKASDVKKMITSARNKTDSKTKVRKTFDRRLGITTFFGHECLQYCFSL